MTTYKGIWLSDMYSPNHVNGEAWANIDFINNKAKFIIKYNGTYNHNLVREFDTNVQYNYSGTFNSYTFNGNTLLNQTISFNAVNLNFDTIDGTYTTENPKDHGTFKINREYFDINIISNALNNLKPSLKTTCVIL